VRARIPGGAVCELRPDPGPVLIRSQGRLRVEGALRRRYRPESVRPAPRLSAVEERQLFTSARTLTELVDLIRRESLDVTVLLAGGDLDLVGKVDTDRPLVLVAGGRIRTAIRERVAAERVYFADHGTAVLHFDSATGVDPAVECSLEFDPPRTNPLKQSLRFGVISSSIPPDGRAARWLPTPQMNARDGHGRARVRYIGEHVSGELEPSKDAVVEDPAVLVECPTLRLMIELTIDPAGPWLPPWSRAPVEPREGEPWDPPWLDDVMLQFEPEGSRDGR